MVLDSFKSMISRAPFGTWPSPFSIASAFLCSTPRPSRRYFRRLWYEVFVLLSLIAVSFSTYSMWYQNSAVTSISMFGFWFSLFMLVFYIFHVVECFYKIPWLKIEMIFDVCWPILYLLSASSAAAYTGLHFSYMISLLFGFAAMFAYGYDALLKYQAIQRGEIAQGNIAVHKQTTTSTASY